MANPVAVLGCTLTYQGTLASSITVPAPPTWAPDVDTKVSADNKGVYFGAQVLTLNGVIAAGLPGFSGTGICATMTATFTPTATKVKSPFGFVLLMGDKATGVGVFQGVNPSGSPISLPDTITVTIANAGQTKVLGS